MNAPPSASEVEPLDQARLHICRDLGPLGFAATITSPQAILDQIADAFADLPEAAVTDTLVGVEVTAERRVDGERLFRIDIEGLPPWRTDEPRAVVDHIVTSLTRTVLDRTEDRLHLHAGLVLHNEVGVLFAGASGAGKSTLVAASVRNGWGYVTDEMVAVDLEDALVTGLPKPLTLKTNTWDLHADVLGPRPGRGERWSVRASRLGALATPGPHQVGLIVFPRFGDGPLSVAPVHPSTAVVRLVNETLDLERSGVAGFAALARMVARAPAVEVHYTDAKEAHREISAAFTTESPRTVGGTSPIAFEAVPSVGQGDLIHRHRAPTTVSFVLNGRAALYDDQRGLAAELDKIATLWWLALDGQQSVTAIATMFAEAVQGDRHEIERAGNHLLEELAGIGFVR